MGNRKAKTDKGWAGHKLFGHTFSERDIRTPEDKYQDAVLANLEEKAKKPKKKKMKCHCHTCRPIDYRDPDSVYMRLCPTCGNKRCPRATDHRYECTNSNEPNQVGSLFSRDVEESE